MFLLLAGEFIPEFILPALDREVHLSLSETTILLNLIVVGTKSSNMEFPEALQNPS